MTNTRTKEAGIVKVIKEGGPKMRESVMIYSRPRQVRGHDRSAEVVSSYTPRTKNRSAKGAMYVLWEGTSRDIKG